MYNKCHRLTSGLVLMVMLAQLAILAGCNKAGDDTVKPTSEATLEELGDLAERVAAVASIRYTGRTDETEQIIRSTISGEYANRMVKEYNGAYRKEFISLKSEIDNAYLEHYNSLYVAGIGGDPGIAEPPTDIEPTTSAEPTQAPETTDSAESSGDEAENPGNTHDYLVDSDEDFNYAEWEDEGWEDNPDTGSAGDSEPSREGTEDQESLGTEPATPPAIATTPTPSQTLEPTFSQGPEPAQSEDGTDDSWVVPEYEDWLQSDEAKNLGYLDVRITYENGIPGIWTTDVQADAEGYAGVVILDQVVRVYVGTDISKLGLVGDHAYDFEVQNYGLYDNGVCVITLKSKDVELPMDSGGGEDDTAGGDSVYMTSVYTLTLKGTIGRDQGTDRLMFNPTDESYVHLVSDLSIHSGV